MKKHIPLTMTCHCYLRRPLISPCALHLQISASLIGHYGCAYFCKAFWSVLFVHHGILWVGQEGFCLVAGDVQPLRLLSLQQILFQNVGCCCPVFPFSSLLSSLFYHVWKVLPIFPRFMIQMKFSYPTGIFKPKWKPVCFSNLSTRASGQILHYPMQIPVSTPRSKENTLRN